MLNKKQIEENQDRTTNLLISTKRPGMKKLLKWLKNEGFFDSPASTRFHGCYEGGLVAHSLNVFDCFTALCERCSVTVDSDSAAIAALLHDICKVGAYVGDEAPYKSNRDKPSGHAVLSIKRITKFIHLTELEEQMVLYHMGVYGLTDFDAKRGEYPLRGGGMAKAWSGSPAVKLMYFADEMATLVEKAEEGGAL